VDSHLGDSVLSYHIFDKNAVDMICREYGGDPRVMVVALNGAVSDELRDLAEAATELTEAIGADNGDEIGRLKVADAKASLELAARKYSERQIRMARLHGD
jgi:hypothetical protein